MPVGQPAATQRPPDQPGTAGEQDVHGEFCCAARCAGRPASTTAYTYTWLFECTADGAPFGAERAATIGNAASLRRVLTVRQGCDTALLSAILPAVAFCTRKAGLSCTSHIDLYKTKNKMASSCTEIHLVQEVVIMHTTLPTPESESAPACSATRCGSMAATRNRACAARHWHSISNSCRSARKWPSARHAA